MITKQNTLAKSLCYQGIGLHSGKPVDIILSPAPPGTGIRFLRTDIEGAEPIIASVENVTDTMRATTISNSKGESVATVEHLLAALSMLGVDNCLISLSTKEPPITDGSGKVFAELILEAGIVEQDVDAEVFEIDRILSVHDGDKDLYILPHKGFRITFTSVNPHPLLGEQRYTVDLDRETFLKEIAPARTIGFTHEIEALRKMGLGLGGTLENVIVYDENSVLSELRFDNELVRHKILDLIGDLSLVGRLNGWVIATKSSHALNAQLAKKIKELKEQEGRVNMITLNVQQIQEIIPHRYPFLLLDRMIELEPMKRGVGIKNVTFNEFHFMGHFPGEPIMPGVLIVEAMAQVGGVTMLYPPENRGKLTFFTGLDNVKFRKPVVPGDQLIMTAEVTRVRGTMGRIKCQGHVNGELVAEAECGFAIVDPDDRKKQRDGEKKE